jgi:membrane protein DedA with SNARE-associated domain
MDTWIAGITEHGYVILFTVAFLEALGLPIPGALATLMAGAACARGLLNPWICLGGAIPAILLGDLIGFVLGRYAGWGMLSLLCRLSLNPESCILRSADSFYRRGRLLLVIAKFLPAINTMAPPLAGSMRMRFLQFLGLDIAGAALYAGSYFVAGVLGSDAVEPITRSYRAFGGVLNWVLLAGVVIFIVVRLWSWHKSAQWRKGPLATAEEAAAGLDAGKAIVYDVRSHGYYDPNGVRIAGSLRLDPNALNQEQSEFPPGKIIYVYCT